MTRKEMIESLRTLEAVARTKMENAQIEADDTATVYHMGQKTAFATAVAMLECTEWVE